jgi:hypothetical protein
MNYDGRAGLVPGSLRAGAGISPTSGEPVRHLFRKRYRTRPMNHEGGRLNEG